MTSELTVWEAVEPSEATPADGAMTTLLVGCGPSVGHGQSR